MAVFNYVRTLLHSSGRAESLQTKSHDASAQNLVGRSLPIYFCMCSLSSPEAGGRKFLEADLRPTNEQTIAEQLSPTGSVSTSSLPTQVAQNFRNPICATDVKIVGKH